MLGEDTVKQSNFSFGAKGNEAASFQAETHRDLRTENGINNTLRENYFFPLEIKAFLKLQEGNTAKDTKTKMYSHVQYKRQRESGFPCKNLAPWNCFGMLTNMWMSFIQIFLTQAPDIIHDNRKNDSIW